jgi:hypothetical protein
MQLAIPLFLQFSVPQNLITLILLDIKSCSHIWSMSAVPNAICVSVYDLLPYSISHVFSSNSLVITVKSKVHISCSHHINVL